MMNLQHYLTK